MKNNAESKAVHIPNLSTFLVSALIGTSIVLQGTKPGEQEASEPIFGIELYFKSGHTMVLSDTNPEYLEEVRKILTYLMLEEKHPKVPKDSLLNNFVIEIKKADQQAEPISAEIVQLQPTT